MMNNFQDAFDKGWFPIPLNRGNPATGFTGREGRYPTASDIEQWDREQDEQITYRLAPDVIGLDVDAWKLAGANPLPFDLPDTWRSTSRLECPYSGIYFYRLPAGFDQALLKDRPQCEVIRSGYRHAIVWPSKAKRTGTVKRWIGPDGVLRDEGFIPDVADMPEIEPTILAYFTEIPEKQSKLKKFSAKDAPIDVADLAPMALT